ncbi:hypothetical protein M3Y99_00142400 [Aphelenchoides fujianensis]|nr:hypothetical protein M3Y99_00142400 [Aphelenchoides fujianensis]
MISSTKAQFQFDGLQHDAESPRVFGIGIHVVTRMIAAFFACVYFALCIAHGASFAIFRFGEDSASDWTALLQNLLVFSFLLVAAISSVAFYFATITSQDRGIHAPTEEKSFQSVLNSYDGFRYLSAPMVFAEIFGGLIPLGNCLVSLLRLMDWTLEPEKAAVQLLSSTEHPPAASSFPFGNLVFGFGLLFFSYLHLSCIQVVQKDREYLVNKHHQSSLLPTRHSFHPAAPRRPLIRPTRLPL